jgi:hypothetical protein
MRFSPVLVVLVACGSSTGATIDARPGDGARAADAADATDAISTRDAVTGPTTITTLSGPAIVTWPIDATGDVAPSHIITGSNTQLGDAQRDPAGLAIAADGTIYVSTETSLLAFAPGATGDVAPIRTIAGSNALASGAFLSIALDPTGATLYAATNNSVLMFDSGANGDVAPTKILAGGATTIDSPTTIAVLGGQLYVGDSTPSQMAVFDATASGNVAPTRLFTVGDLIYGIALDPAGDIIVGRSAEAAPSQLSIYAADATGSDAPIGSLGGSATGILAPGGVAIDASGTIYVANAVATFMGNHPSLLVFAPGSTGNVAPMRTIAGTTTGLLGGIGMPVVVH